jgi:hypothetical protein
MSENKYRFGGSSVKAASRPSYAPWSADRPYPSVVFDGTDDFLTMDLAEQANGRDADFDLQFPEQINFLTTQDAETTCFLLYRPLGIELQDSTVFSKGDPGLKGGSFYLYYSRRASTTSWPERSLDTLGMAV